MLRRGGGGGGGLLLAGAVGLDTLARAAATHAAGEHAGSDVNQGKVMLGVFVGTFCLAITVVFCSCMYKEFRPDKVAPAPGTTKTLPYRSPAPWLNASVAKRTIELVENAKMGERMYYAGNEQFKTPRKALQINAQVEPWDKKRGFWVDSGVFISCNLVEGLEHARALQKALRDLGVEAYINYYQTSLMDDFVRTVGTRIRAAHVVVALGTKNYAVEDSRVKGSWEELGCAVTLRKKIEFVEMCRRKDWLTHHKGNPPPAWTDKWDPMDPQPPFDLAYHVSHIVREMHSNTGKLPAEMRYLEKGAAGAQRTEDTPSPTLKPDGRAEEELIAGRV